MLNEFRTLVTQHGLEEAALDALLAKLGEEGLVLERGERGTGTHGWKAALNALAVHFPGRVPV